MRPSPTIVGAAATLIALSGSAHSAPRISEFMASNDTTLADVDGDFSDWIEIHNPDPTAVDLAGYHLTDDPADPTRWGFPAVTLAAGGRLVVFASGKDRTDPGAELHTDFQLDAKGEYLALVAPDGSTVLSGFSPFYPPQSEDQSYGASPFGTAVPETFVPHGATARYLVPSDGSLGQSWAAPEFDDAAWASGPSGFGWETSTGALLPFVATDLRDQMQSINASAYFRFPFAFDASSSSVQSLSLTVQDDDGFIAYLNGVEVARERAPAGALWNSSATGSGSDSTIANNPSTFDISNHANLIVDGANLLAIHGLNFGAGGSDFLIRPLLEAEVQDTSGAFYQGYYSAPTPGAPDSDGTAAGPIFEDFTDRPERPTAGEDLLVTASMAEANAPTASVTLFYRVMYGAEAELPMRDDGAGGDAVAGDGTYSATIPGAAFSPGDMVRWRFVATDSLGFVTREPRYPDPLDSHQYVGTAAIDPAVESRLDVAELFVQNIAAAGSLAGTRGAIFYLGELYDNIYFNRHGQSTGGFPKKSYNLDFNKTQRFRWHPDEKRVKDIDLLTNWADKSKVRHVLAWELQRLAGVPGHFAFTVRVQNNGEFYSTADFVEDADDIYLERAGLNPDGALYKIYNNTLTAGDSTTSPAAEKKNRRYENSADFNAFISGINSGTTDQQWGYIYDNVDLPACVNVAAAWCLIRNTDVHRKNWYLYRDSGISDEWAILPWDLDLSQGRRWNSSETYFDHDIESDGFIQVGTAIRLVSMMWARPEVREMMMRRIRTLTDRYLQPESTPFEQRWYERRLDEQVALIDPPDIVPSDARLDFEKWGSWIQGSGAQVPYTSTHLHVEDMAEGIARWHAEYLPGRRAFMYGSANMPAPQSGQISYAFTPLVASAASMKYKVPTDGSEDAAWFGGGFDDASWGDGTTGIGYDSAKYLPLIGANTEAAMKSITATAYMRIPFNVADPAAFAKLELRMKYDDGFIAYLNGTQVAAANAPAAPAWNSTATTSSQEALVDAFEVFDISAHLDRLVPGDNVLAFHCMNGSAGSSDFLVLPELHGGAADSAGSAEPLIAFGQIEFNPASGDQAQEYVELVNNNNIAVDVSDWTVEGGIDFTLPGGTVIPGNTSLFLSPDKKAFRGRAASPKGGERRLVVGPYSGHLSNFGEELVLRDQTGAVNNVGSYVGAPSDAQRYLVVSELHYHPPGDGLAEFIELLNISPSVTLDLTGVRFTDGVQFDFTGGAVTGLPPGGRVLVVRDQAAFEAAFGAGLPVAGVFGTDTALSNGGELIKLEDADNGTVREFEYRDSPPWPTAADGGGSSLQLIGPAAAPDHALPESWTASAPSPGAEGAIGFTGDPLADSDADGLAALIEYALGTSAADPASGPGAFAPGIDAGGRSTFTYQRSLASSDVALVIETTADLELWQTAAEAGLQEVARIDNGDGTETITLATPTAIAPGSARAYRLRATK